MMRLFWLPFMLAAAAGWPEPSSAQTIADGLLENTSLAGNSVQLIVLITILSLAPGILIMITCFPFMITVLSILRQGIGLQQSPPNMLLISLALFLTYFVMEPVFQTAWETGLKPFSDGTLIAEEAFVKAVQPFREFMAARIDGETFIALSDLRDTSAELPVTPEADLSILVPSFMLSEISRAFQVGFLLFLPFMIIDLVVAAILMSMGMMMVPPVIVSLPFKLAFFVVADGWTLIASGLVQGYF